MNETNYKELYENERDERIAHYQTSQTLQAIINMWEAFHPRAIKLLRKRKNFIVIAEDEPYFLQAYNLIRAHEASKNTWTQEDEDIYKATFDHLVER